MSYAVLLLAAGQSRRFGAHNKLLSAYRGKPLVAQAANVARRLHGTLRFVSVSSIKVASLMPDFRVAWVPNPEVGQSQSLRFGMSLVAQSDVEGCLVMLGDMPNLTPDILHDIVETGRSFGVSAATNDRLRCPPAYFHRQHFTTLMRSQGDSGARQLLRAIKKEALVRVPDKALLDIDRPSGLNR